ncbi:hypothetical protein NEOLEDRAFT_1240014 [Neolentinus lepideus HHB14362 ss-1]|uniref:F-box domain-containing protein n=1 Tax=Neolentinus lepideus HHB14362 ss-1 TaxID=1314782 RepID=A0A165UAK3_9AGAM|nr:hypothetical protein NEOLEDRAFT_1240014 [Neolentinus lepideus HHB14362 ss-1]
MFDIESGVSVSWLPAELYDTILREIWSSSLSPEDRVQLLVTLPLVNKAWLSIFAPIVMTDVYIATPKYGLHYIQLLRETPVRESKSLWTAATAAAASRSRSLTFHIHGDSTLFPVQIYRATNAMGDTFVSTLYTIAGLGFLPNLHRLSIEYENWGFDDLFDHYRLIAFPQQITHLNLKYSYNAKFPSLSLSLKEYLRGSYVRHRCSKCRLHSIRSISLDGVPVEFVRDILGLCPNTETLEVSTTLAESLERLHPLSETVHTIVLRNTEGATRDAQLDSMLAKSILQCCFPSLRIVMERDMDRQACKRIGGLSYSHSLEILRPRAVQKL